MQLVKLKDYVSPANTMEVLPANTAFMILHSKCFCVYSLRELFAGCKKAVVVNGIKP